MHHQMGGYGGMNHQMGGYGMGYGSGGMYPNTKVKYDKYGNLKVKTKYKHGYGGMMDGGMYGGYGGHMGMGGPMGMNQGMYGPMGMQTMRGPMTPMGYPMQPMMGQSPLMSHPLAAYGSMPPAFGPNYTGQVNQMMPVMSPRQAYGPYSHNSYSAYNPLSQHHYPQGQFPMNRNCQW